MQAFIDTALRLGAKKAAVIPAQQIVLSAEFRAICQSNGCGMYDRCWMCPPHVGEIESLMEQVRSFRYGLLYQTVSNLEDSFDIEGMLEAGQRHAQLSQRIEKSGMLPENHLHLTCGGCRLCERCAKRDNEPCRFPGEALPSMEAYGIDVYNTTKDTPLKYINGKDTVTFFGIVLF